MNGLDPAVTEAINCLLQATTEITAPAALSARQRAMSPAIVQNQVGLLEGHPFRLVGDHQQGPSLMPLILDADPAGHLSACLVQPSIAIIAVGNQFDQGFFYRSKAARIDINDPLVHRNCFNRHIMYLASLIVV